MSGLNLEKKRLFYLSHTEVSVKDILIGEPYSIVLLFNAISNSVRAKGEHAIEQSYYFLDISQSNATCLWQ